MHTHRRVVDELKKQKISTTYCLILWVERIKLISDLWFSDMANCSYYKASRFIFSDRMDFSVDVTKCTYGRGGKPE